MRVLPSRSSSRASRRPPREGVTGQADPLDSFSGIIIFIKMSFKERVLNVVASISRGKTLSYKQVAILAGSPRAYRAVGNIMNKNENPKVPCHRVIKSDGTVGGYARGTKMKKAILEKEGAI